LRSSRRGETAQQQGEHGHETEKDDDGDRHDEAAGEDRDAPRPRQHVVAQGPRRSKGAPLGAPELSQEHFHNFTSGTSRCTAKANLTSSPQIILFF